jgi:hypothetical protein
VHFVRLINNVKLSTNSVGFIVCVSESKMRVQNKSLKHKQVKGFSKATHLKSGVSPGKIG